MTADVDFTEERRRNVEGLRAVSVLAMIGEAG
jgi:hypothetical protein